MAMAFQGSSTCIRLLVVLLVTATMAEAQGSQTVGTCAAQLLKCVSYLNATTTPPSSCCGPLKDAVTNQRACLCGLYHNPDIWMTINVTQALNLSVLCRIHADTSHSDICKGESRSGTGSGSNNNSAATVAETVYVSILLTVVTYVIICSV